MRTAAPGPRRARRRTARGALAVALALAAPAAASAQGAPAFGVTHLTPAVRDRMTPSVWRPGCPVPLGALRRVLVTHRDYAGRSRRGVLVVHRDVAGEVMAVFRRLHADGVRIARVRPIEAYGGDDYRSIEADNTSAFNCRRATGSTRWSQHAYGRAIDVNPLRNPYVLRGSTSHPRSRPYLDRDRVRPGMAVEGGALVRAFDRAGWHWGGRWREPRDYQHFSRDGG